MRLNMTQLIFGDKKAIIFRIPHLSVLNLKVMGGEWGLIPGTILRIEREQSWKFQYCDVTLE